MEKYYKDLMDKADDVTILLCREDLTKNPKLLAAVKSLTKARLEFKRQLNERIKNDKKVPVKV